MIGPDFKLILCMDQVVSPYFEGFDNCEEFLIVDFLVLFGVEERFGHECNRVPFSLLFL
jgi:hypothetical protein